MRLYPSDQPTAGVERGVMYYNDTENVIKYRNNNTWVNMTEGGGGGGGGVYYTYYCFSNSTYGTPVCINVGGTQGYCPSGYTQKFALGSWGTCGANIYGSCFLPPGGSCGGSCGVKLVLGSAYVCSQ